MPKTLEGHLVTIEKELGGDGKLPKNYAEIDKLDYHLTKIEDLIEGGSSGGIEDVKVNDTSIVEDNVANIKLKTINDESITGEGNITIESGTQVVANPTLAGTETILEGLQVGDTKYSVGGGSSGGCHAYRLYFDSDDEIVVYSDDNNLTWKKFVDSLTNLVNYYVGMPIISYSAPNNLKFLVYFYSFDNTSAGYKTVRFRYYTGTFNSSTGQFSWSMTQKDRNEYEAVVVSKIY